MRTLMIIIFFASLVFSQNFEPKFGLTLEQAIAHYKLPQKHDFVKTDDNGAIRYRYTVFQGKSKLEMDFTFFENKLVAIDIFELFDNNFDHFWEVVNKKVQFWKKKYAQPTFIYYDFAPNPPESIEIPNNKFKKPDCKEILEKHRNIYISCSNKNIVISSNFSIDHDKKGYAFSDYYQTREYYDLFAEEE